MHVVEKFPLANIYSRLNNANFKDFIILIFKNNLQVTIPVIITIYMISFFKQSPEKKNPNYAHRMHFFRFFLTIIYNNNLHS